MTSLLKQLKNRSAEEIENKLMVEFYAYAISKGYAEHIVNAAIDQTILQGCITKIALLANLNDKNIKENR